MPQDVIYRRQSVKRKRERGGAVYRDEARSTDGAMRSGLGMHTQGCGACSRQEDLLLGLFEDSVMRWMSLGDQRVVKYYCRQRSFPDS